ncbi:MAG: HEAT repeat domain-containing protein [Sedimentisphaerales bacterium]|nr:HEAT repeat domain-containing protein [Sedimentisphaerales bacterium]
MSRNNDSTVSGLLSKLKDSDAGVRTEAWQGAGSVGAAGVESLAGLMTDGNLEVARAAKRALWRIVRYTGRPGARSESREVAVKLNGVLGGDAPVAVRREILWMLSEIGSRRRIEPIAELLSHKELREDARMVLERIGGRRALSALQGGFESAPEEFKQNLAQSIRKLGGKVEGYECVKLVPTKETTIKALPD